MWRVYAFPTLANTTQLVIFNPIIEGGNGDLRIPLAQPVCFTHDKIYFVANFMHKSQIHKMFLSGFPAPPCPLYQAIDEFFFSLDEINHTAVIMTDQRDVAHFTNGDRVGDLELAIAKICPSGTNNKCKIIGHMQVLAIVHAHTDQESRLFVCIKPAVQIVILQQQPYGITAISGRYIFFFG